MPLERFDRRKFLTGAIATAGVAGAGPLAFANTEELRPEYRGPNVIIVRFGGGARRLETIDAQHTWSPYLFHELIPRGAFFPSMEITDRKDIQVSHGPGTLNILTGIYDVYKDVGNAFLGERFEAKVPTLFEYLRAQFNIPDYQTLIVNNENRLQEEFYTFSSHHNYGINYRANVLSLYRFKVYLLRRQIADWKGSDKELAKKRVELAKMESKDYRVTDHGAQAPETEAFWERWREYYGESGLRNPRGDAVLTELAVRAIRELKPRLMMINYNDCDYVHWGNINHYTRGIQIMDEGVRRLVEAAESDEHYRGNTLFCIVPDCGRDTNPLRAVPCQHHFNTRSAREIFGLFVGPGVARGVRVDKRVEQISVAATLGGFMGFKADHAQGPALEEAFA